MSVNTSSPARIAAATPEHLVAFPKHAATCPVCLRIFDCRVTDDGAHRRPGGRNAVYCSETHQEWAEDDRRYTRQGAWRPRDSHGRRSRTAVEAESGVYRGPFVSLREIVASEVQRFVAQIREARASGERVGRFLYDEGENRLLLRVFLALHPEAQASVYAQLRTADERRRFEALCAMPTDDFILAVVDTVEASRTLADRVA